ncbi:MULTISPECIES: hypothetical protein [unclassified Lacinutrix]
MATFEDITKWNLKSLLPEVIRQIHELVIKLSTNRVIYNRRQLVDYLNENIEGLDLKEGILLRYILKEAYIKASHSKTVQDGIINNLIENNSNDSIYSPNRLFVNSASLTYDGDYLKNFENKIKLIENNSLEIRGMDVVNILNQSYQSALEVTKKEEFSLTGNTKVENAYKYAVDVKKGYINIINKYDEIKDVNLNLISDFEFLRNELKLLRTDLIDLLIDLFGDSIKNNEPDLFDFSEVEWIDFESTWENLNLYFSQIEQNLQSFKNIHDSEMNKLGESGLQYGKQAFNNLKKKNKSGGLSTGDIKGELAGAAISMAIQGVFSVGKTRSESKKTIAMINKDVEVLKNEMQNDQNKMINDLLRIASIFSHLNDKLIPSFKIFINKVISIIEDDIKPIYKQIESIEGIKEKRDNNSKLIKETRLIRLELADKENGLDFCDIEKVRINDLLNKSQFEYNFVLDIKPEKPSLFYKIVSLGKGTRFYNEVLLEWNEFCLPVVEYYDNLQELLLRQDAIKNEIRTDLKDLNERKIELTSLIKKNSEEIHGIFNKSSFSKDILKSLLKNIKEVSDASKTTISVELLTEDLKILN